MASHYIIAQYVPDSVAGERINIGVITYGEGRVRARFLRNWRRAEQFGRRDVTFLKDFAAEFSDAISSFQISLPEFVNPWKLDERVLRGMVTSWSNSIQFTEPRASTLDPETLLLRIEQRFLIQRAPTKRAYRDRRSSARIAAESITKSLIEVAGLEEARHLLHRNWEVPGQRTGHKVDLAIANGSLLGAVYALSFEVEDNRELNKDVDATAWAVLDVRALNHDLPIVIAALPPTGSSGAVKFYKRAQDVFPSLGARILPSDQVGEWAESIYTETHQDERVITLPTEEASPRALTAGR